MAQLLLCLAILWLFRGVIVFEIRESVGAKGRASLDAISRLIPYPINAMPAPDERLISAKTREQLLWIPSALNLPAMIVDIPLNIWGPDQVEWTPEFIDFVTWRAITWPLVGILFWWIAGRAIDALRAARYRLVQPSIHWAETVLAVMTVAFGIIMFMVPFMNASRHRDDGPPGPLLLSLAGMTWALLGGATIAARVIQWRIRRKFASLEMPEEAH
ncbi:MAG: hypothetical protein WAU89_20170 [Candidatus Acidiferrales bacterium]